MKFFVPGLAKPKGSQRMFTTKAGRSVMATQSPAAKKWQSTIRGIARVFVKDIRGGGVGVRLTFVFERPKSHFTSKGALTKNAPVFPGHNLGDIDKLTRTVLDGLTGVAFKDDTQVVNLKATKRFGPSAGVTVEVFEVTPTHRLEINVGQTKDNNQAAVHQGHEHS